MMKNCVRAAATVAAAAGIALVYWLSAPIGAAPGTPLFMVDENGTDLRVAALTVSTGSDHRWLRLGDSALTHVPPRWLYLLQAHLPRSEQETARARGGQAVRDLLGVHHVEQPESVSLGEVRGTSSGLAWAVATLLLNDPELRTDGVVYATGSLYGNGIVGAIAGLDAKLRTPGLANAAWVLVPAAQHDWAVRSLRDSGNEELAGRVVGVTDVRDALGVLCRRAPQAPTCVFLRGQQSTSQQDVEKDSTRDRSSSTASPR